MCPVEKTENVGTRYYTTIFHRQKWIQISRDPQGQVEYRISGILRDKISCFATLPLQGKKHKEPLRGQNFFQEI